MAVIETPHGPLHYTTVEHTAAWHGNPETIVFHHGLGACSDCWSGWIPALLEKYRLVFFDMRGHGRSAVADDHQWSIDSMVDDLDSVVGSLTANTDQFHLVGESIGGTTALAYATRYSERLKSLTISNGAHTGGSLENLSNWRDIMASGGLQAWSEHMMTMRFYPRAIDDAMWQWYFAQQASCDQRSILAAVEQLVGADLSDALNTITVPTLLMHPDASPFIPLSVMLDLKNKLPSAQLQVFANTRHGLPFSHAAECSNLLARFLAQ